MTYRKIKLEVSEYRAAIQLPPPADGCTIDEDVAAELRECCDGLAQQDDIRVATISGSPAGFAVGRQTPPADVCAAPMPERLAWIDRMGAAAAFATLPMPTIAILNGDAIAHGLELAMAADLRIAASDARIGAGMLAERRFPYDGGTQRLPRLVGPGMARDMLLTGRTLSAHEALEAGLINRVVPPAGLDEATAELINAVVAAAPIANRYIKEAVYAAGDLSLGQGLRLEADLSIILQSTHDRTEGLQSFSDRRLPNFQGR